MSRTPNTKMIGLFTFIGLICFVGFMIIFLSDKLFVRDKDLVVLYFDESIKGLSIGSPVVLRGVEIGKVIKTKMLVDVDNLAFKTPVYIKLDSSQMSRYNDTHVGEVSNVEFLHKLIEKGLRGRLATQNFLTGQLMVELVMAPDEPIAYKGGGVHQEIPTMLSPLGELSKNMQDLPIRESFEKFNGLLEQTTVLVEKANSVIFSSKGDAANTLSNFNKTIQNVGDAAKSLGNFADYIERHPEALLKGKGGY